MPQLQPPAQTCELVTLQQQLHATANRRQRRLRTGHRLLTVGARMHNQLQRECRSGAASLRCARLAPMRPNYAACSSAFGAAATRRRLLTLHP